MLVQSMVSESSLDLQINQLECMRYDRQNAYPVTPHRALFGFLEATVWMGLKLSIVETESSLPPPEHEAAFPGGCC